MPQKKRTKNPPANKKASVKARVVARKMPVKKTAIKPAKKTTSKTKELNAAEIIEAIKNDNIILASSAQDSKTGIALLEKEKVLLKERVDNLKANLNEANMHTNTLAEEVTKRNNNLRILSDAYVELKNGYDNKEKDIDRFKSDRSLKDSVIESLKQELEKKNKQMTRNNLQIEALYKQLTSTDLRAREITLLNNKLQARCDILTEELKKKDIEVVHVHENARMLVGNERQKLKKHSEQMRAIGWQKEQFLRKKIEHIIMQLREKDTIIAKKDKKLAEIMDTYRKIKDFVAAVPIKKSHPLKIRRPAPPHPHYMEKEKEHIPRHIHEEIHKETQKEIHEKIPIKVPKEIAPAPKTAEMPPPAPRKPFPQDMPKPKAPAKTETAEEPVFLESEPIVIKEQKKNEEFLPYLADEIVSMVHVAKEHGDSFEVIKQSLVNSGYKPIEVDKAIEKAKLIK